ncbi:MAG: glycosyltransferase [Candidatus Thorarchaeota archaeon]
MSKVLVVSEYYNEADNIPGLVDNLAEQTQRPDLILLIDDGSNDDSTKLFEKHLQGVGLESILYTMPPKVKPDANLKGRAYTKVDILNTDWLDTNDYDYLLKVDADSRMPKTYIELGTKILDKFPIFGTMAGRIHGEPGSPTPMGTGKFVRWSVVKKTRGRYWDIDPDSLWNLIAIAMGYRMIIPKDMLLTVTRPTHMYGPKGYYNFGRRMYYVGWNLANALFYTFTLLSKRDQPQYFLRGYLHAYTERNWRIQDSAIKDYFSLARMFRRRLGSSYQTDFATILDVGMTPKYEEKLTDDFLEDVYAKIQATLA